MLIDWFTVGAQALNFVVLAWLMKRFLYKPILHAIDAREKLIAAELADATAKKAEAHKERDDFEHKNEELDRQRSGLLKKAADDANAERQRLINDARKAADELSAKRRETLRTDAKNLDQAIQRRAQQEVFAIARKALTDLATTGLEERLAAVFTRRLRDLDGATKAGLASALKAASDAAIVRSAFELPPDQRAVIQNALNETFSADVHIRFETAPDLVSGIELATNGQKVGWTISDYLKSLQEGVDDLLTKKVEAEAKAEAPKPEPTKPDAKPEPAKAEPNGTKPKANGATKSEVDRAPQNTESAALTPKAKVDPEPKTKADPEPQAEPEPEAAAKPPEPEAPADSKPVVKPAPRPDAAVEPRPAAKAAARPEVNAAPKPDATSSANPEAPRSEAKIQ